MTKYKLHPEQRSRATHIFSLDLFIFAIENNNLIIVPKIKKHDGNK